VADLLVPLLLGCLVALASALAVVLARRPVYAAIGLLVHSLSLAALFGILSAGMVAVGQVIIYSGAIVVLFLFVVTLLPLGGRELAPTGGRVAAAFIAGASLVVARAITAFPRPREQSGLAGLAGRFAGLQKGFRETVAELRKVQWPDRMTTRNLTLVVIGMSVALSALLGLFDALLTRLFEWLIRI
jgi:preprotein translocase SecE subunit